MHLSFGFASALVGLLGALQVTAQNSTWPYQSYRSVAFQPPSLNVTKYGPTSPGYLFFSQTGSGAHEYSLFIFTEENELVWQSVTSEYGNFRVQEYQGKQMLTYFNGVELPEPYGYGTGLVQMRDETYASIQNVTIQSEGIETLDTLDTTGWLSWIDMHEGIITPENTMLVTVNNVTQTNLSSVGGPEDGWIVDSLFYEVDIATNTSLFRWRHLDHLDEIPLANALPYYPLSYLGENATYPWGPFHINSVEKFADGSYLISSRFYCSLFKISKNGTLEWTLNGQNGGDFKLGDGLSFCYQHDARIHKEDRNSSTYLISIFDNANSSEDSEYNGLTNTTGIFMEVNTNTWEASVVRKYEDPHDSVKSVSQGNTQLLPDKHVIMGYGSVPKIKEYDANGTILMSVQFGEPSLVQSYRAFRFPWVGKPTAPPDVFACQAQNGTEVYMSWNGATEHKSWNVYAGASETNMTLAAREKKTGFETKAVVSGRPQYVRVEAEGLNITTGVSAVVFPESQC